MPVFPLLNATVRIIEPLATTFRKELLRIKCRFDSCRERDEDRASAFVGALFFYSRENFFVPGRKKFDFTFLLQQNTNINILILNPF